MKKYIQPIIKVAAIELQQMIAESLTNDDDVITNEDQFDAHLQIYFFEEEEKEDHEETPFFTVKHRDVWE